MRSTKKKSKRALTTSEFVVEDIPVVFTRKQVKNINFRVKAPDGHVEVSAPYWVDEATIKQHVSARKEWIRAKQAQLRLSRLHAPRMSAPELAEAKKLTAARAEPYFAYWEQRIRVKAKVFAYREMSSRWGSCNPRTGRICLNTRLLDYPEECLEYVVVHELCHLIEGGHGPAFKALLDEHLPDWRQRRAQLRSEISPN